MINNMMMNKLWAYPCMIIVLLIFIGYQLYRIAIQPGAGLVALTIFDVAIVALTWRKYGRQRRIAGDSPPTSKSGWVTRSK
jgi:uncharacterized membrane protein